jgi:hypothetical protein
VEQSGQLADRQAIEEVVLRYCRGVDRLDMALVRSAYHPDGVDHHTGFSGPVDDYIAWVEPALRRFTGTLHIIGNHLCEIAGDVAVAESYGQAVHWGEPADDPRRNFTSGFRYVDHMTRRNGRWAIQERWAVREFTHSNAGRALPKEGVGPGGERGPGDPLAQLRAKLGLA